MKTPIRLSSFLLSILILGGTPNLRAASTWSGNAGTNWNDAGNWDVLPVPSATEALIFTGALNLNNTNNFANGSVFNLIDFDSAAGAFSLGGNSINLGDGTAGIKIRNTSVNLQTVITNLALQQNTEIDTGASGMVIGGNISGGFGLTKSGSGDLNLTAANGFTGATKVGGGTLTLSDNTGAITSSSSISVVSGASLILDNTSNNLNRIGDSASLTLSGGTFNFFHPGAASTTYSETMGQLNLGSGFSTLTLSGAPVTGSSIVTFSALNRTAGSLLNVSNNTNLGTNRNRILLTSAPTLTNGILAYASANNGGGNTQSFMTYDVTNGLVPFLAYDSGAAEGTWTNATNLLQTAAVTLTANRTINSITMGAGSALNLDLGGNTLTIESGGIINRSTGSGGRIWSNGNVTAGILNVGGELLLSSFQANSGQTFTITASITDNGTGPVHLVLGGQANISGTNTYSGGTSLLGGTVRFTDDSAFGAASGTVTVAASTVLSIQASSVTLSASRNIVINEGAALTYQAAANSGGNVNVIAGNISGAGAFIRQGGSGLATVRLEGTNTFTGGTFLNSGNTEARNGAALADNGAVVFAPASSTATLRIIDSETIGSLASSGAGTSVVDISAGQTLTIGGDNTSTTYQGTMTGATGGLTKIGTGTQTLASALSYGGTTLINAGTLLVSNSTGSATGSGPVSLGAATLGGTGSIDGLVTTAGTTSVIAPGASAGTLTLAGGLDASAGVNFKFELGATSGDPDSDLLSLGSGAFTGSAASGGLIFDFTSIGGGTASGVAYTLLTFGSATDFDRADIFTNILPGDLILDASFGDNGYLLTGSDLQVRFSPVPEPATLVMVLGGLGLLLGSQRSRRRSRA